MEGTKNEKVYSGLGTEEPQTEPLQGGALGKVTCPDVSQGHQESKATGDIEELEVEMEDRDEVPKGQRPKRGRTEGEIETTPVKGGEVFEWAGSQSEDRGWSVERIIRTKKVRRHSFVSSPEELKGMAEESFVVKEYCEEMDQLINEIRSYTDRTLSTKDRRHVNYILPRLERIMEARTKWEEEARRMRRCEWVESKIANIEQEITSMNPREWKQDMKDMINEIVEDRVKEIVKGVKKELQDFGKKVRQDNEVMMRSLEECDQNRKEEEEKIKNLIRIETCRPGRRHVADVRPPYKLTSVKQKSYMVKSPTSAGRNNGYMTIIPRRSGPRPKQRRRRLASWVDRRLRLLTLQMIKKKKKKKGLTGTNSTKWRGRPCDTQVPTITSPSGEPGNAHSAANNGGYIWAPKISRGCPNEDYGLLMIMTWRGLDTRMYCVLQQYAQNDWY
ncbi:unnamed protein product [Nezara viridula]|uniref:Uncharacterized protein n=1 Tax=Nezara viridula TaxID=85310 RepID=A0A9P0H068_NEZVI|nr:unnamed protein product [Nezara viridula]